MTGSKEKIKEELDGLIKEGHELVESVMGKDISKFGGNYQVWYTRSLAVVRHLVPDRLQDFERLYHNERRTTIDIDNYTIEDFLRGVFVWDVASRNRKAAGTRLWNQVKILESAATRLDDILANIQGVLQADLFDSEIDAARHLKNNGHLRAAGAVAGVVLERHLAKMCQNHGITVSRKNPTISTYNDLLKENDILDIAPWRGIQHLGDLRNLCDHDRTRDPTPDEVDELINGVDKAIKTLS